MRHARFKGLEVSVTFLHPAATFLAVLSALPDVRPWLEFPV